MARATVVFPDPLLPTTTTRFTTPIPSFVMVAGLVVQPIDSLPEDVAGLLGPSRAEGHNLVERLVDEWNDRSNRFDGPGESIFEARVDSRLAAVGGLNRDPYLDDPEVARIRHVYVSPDVRGVGVGRALVLAMVDHARLGFTRVRLRTERPEGSAFYLAIGFEETTSEADATHGWRL
jgi:GNAT superfamily N-acetyltransferase